MCEWRIWFSRIFLLSPPSSLVIFIFTREFSSTFHGPIFSPSSSSLSWFFLNRKRYHTVTSNCLKLHFRVGTFVINLSSTGLQKKGAAFGGDDMDVLLDISLDCWSYSESDTEWVARRMFPWKSNACLCNAIKELSQCFDRICGTRCMSSQNTEA